jgi:ribosome-binding protein aMBF1 (putative translation factor)
MTDSVKRIHLTARDFCWDEYFRAHLASLTPSEFRRYEVKENMAKIGATIFEVREDAGTTIGELASASGVKPELLRRIEDLERYPYLEYVVAIVHELGYELVMVPKEKRASD